MGKENAVLDKSYAFAIKIVRMYQHLSFKKKEFILSKQLLRTGTSIGANVEEAMGGISKKDFKAKLGIAYKEARESRYCLRLLRDTDYLTEDSSQPMIADCEELLKLLYVIIKNTSS